MQDAFKNLERFKPVTPCDATLAQLMAIPAHRRTFAVAELTGPKGFCVWCAAPVTGQRRRWCSGDCATSSQMWCYPHTPASKLFRLIELQQCACAGCGESYEELIAEKIARAWKRQQSERGKPWYSGRSDEPITYFQVGYGTGDIWHVDHILPIHKGGRGTGPANVQVLCVACHKVKTADERWDEETSHASGASED